MIAQGMLPHVQKLREHGCSGVLHSTEPPLTPPAWTTLMTGVNPGKHQAFSFERYDGQSNCSQFTSSKSIAVETMWTYLSRLGYKVASLNLPQIYARMGVALPGHLDGKVMAETFAEEIKINYDSGDSGDGKQTPIRPGGESETGLTDQEEQLIAKRLQDLGYLE